MGSSLQGSGALARVKGPRERQQQEQPGLMLLTDAVWRALVVAILDVLLVHPARVDKRARGAGRPLVRLDGHQRFCLEGGGVGLYLGELRGAA